MEEQKDQAPLVRARTFCHIHVWTSEGNTFLTFCTI